MQRKRFLFEIVCNQEAVDFFQAHCNENPQTLALRHTAKVNFPLAPIIEWIEASQRGSMKLPTHVEKKCYLTRRALEQASSEAAARYKASQIEGESLLNLCGGIGVDDWGFSATIQQIYSLENDQNLHELSKANCKKLGVENVRRIHADAEEHLASNVETYEWIYADPDRRDSGKRLVSLADCSPNVLALWPIIQKKSKNQLLKLSPLYPLEQLEKELPGVERVEIVAWQNEVKEVLVFCSTQGPFHPMVRKAVSIEASGIRSFQGIPEKGTTSECGLSGFFYEVHPTIAKANLGINYALSLGIENLIPNGLFHYAISWIPDYFGRGFEIVFSGAYSKKIFQDYLNQNGVKKANFSCRFFKQSPEELKKAHRILDGGEDYFFFFENQKKQSWFVHGKKFADKS